MSHASHANGQRPPGKVNVVVERYEMEGLPELFTTLVTNPTERAAGELVYANAIQLQDASGNAGRAVLDFIDCGTFYNLLITGWSGRVDGKVFETIEAINDTYDGMVIDVRFEISRYQYCEADRVQQPDDVLVVVIPKYGDRTKYETTKALLAKAELRTLRDDYRAKFVDSLPDDMHDRDTLTYLLRVIQTHFEDRPVKVQLDMRHSDRYDLVVRNWRDPLTLRFVNRILAANRLYDYTPVTACFLQLPDTRTGQYDFHIHIHRHKLTSVSVERLSLKRTRALQRYNGPLTDEEELARARDISPDPPAAKRIKGSLSMTRTHIESAVRG